LALFYRERLSGIALDHRLTDDFHRILLDRIELKLRKLLTERRKSKAAFRISAGV